MGWVMISIPRCLCWCTIRSPLIAVNTKDAGVGDLDVHVTCVGQPVTTAMTYIDEYSSRYTFVPIEPHVHMGDIMFNYEKVPSES